MSDQPRPVFNDRYEIRSRVGRGGMADVFRAHDRLLDRPVAIKVLVPEFATDPTFVERFRREAQAAANLTHPNIVGVFDWGRQDNTYFIVMEYVAGKSLAEVLRAEGPLDAARAAEIANDVAAALGFAHRNQVVHRDVKPANILVSDTGQVKVADFGIARAMNTPTEQDLTQAGAVMGTATYFSPEQAQGAQPDPRSDLYSLGIVMYEMATGRPPFTGDNPVSIAYKQVHEMPVRPSQLRPGIPQGYEAIIHRLLQKDPAKRYSTAEDLRADLRRFRESMANPADQIGAARALPMDDVTTMIAPQPGLRGAGAGPVAPLDAPTAAVSVTRAQQAYADATRVQQSPRPPSGPDGRYDQPTFDRPPRRTGMIVLAIVATVVAIGGIVFALTKFLGSDSGGGTKAITVENVVGRPFDQATSIIKAQGLDVKITRVASDTAAKDTVISQSPLSGSSAVTGAVIELTVSDGKIQIDLPSVVGTVAIDAQKALEKLGFKVITTSAPSPDKPAGTVLIQDPPAGKAASGATVTLTVSAGKDQVIIPNVINVDQVEAASQLTKLGLTVVAANEANDTIAAGKVIRTDPGVNVAVDKASSVKIFISSGPNPIVVPNVVGKTDTEATDQLQKSNLLRSITVVQVADPAQNGRVISQNPIGDGKQTLPKFGTVVLNVGQYTAPPTTVPPPTTTKAPVTVANVVGQNYVNATNALSSQGLSVVVQRVNSASVPKDDVISQNPTAFSSVPSGSTITLQVSNGP